MASLESDRRRQRIALILLPVLLIALVAAVALGTRGGGTAATSTAPAGAGPAPATEVLLVPISTGVDPFTPPMGTDVAVPPMGATGSAGLVDVRGDAVGLFGGTPGTASSDRSGLADFLAAHPDIARVWANVKGITPEQIPEYIAGLTPAVLRADTLVTDHGWADGKAAAFPAILQAGTAVLVDAKGVPAVHSFSGSPLTAAPDVSVKTSTTGPPWKGFSFGTTVRVQPADTKVADFAMVNIRKNTLFTRPVGTGGKRDTDTGEPAPAGIAGTPAPMGPADGTAPSAPPSSPAASGDAPAAAPTPGSTERPPGEPVTLFEVGSIAGVSSGPPKPTRFTLTAPAYVTSIMTYHYLNKGRPPGTIGLQSSDGTLYGPWQATGTEGQGGVANAYWTAAPNVVIPAGDYTVVDSDPSTWSWAVDTQQRGMTRIDGIPIAGASPAAGAPSGSTASTAAAPGTPPPRGSARPVKGKSSYQLAFLEDQQPAGAPNGGPGTPGRPIMQSADAYWDQSAKGGLVRLDVSWAAPADPGSSPITGYYLCVLTEYKEGELNAATCGESDGPDLAGSLAWRDLIFASDPPNRIFVSAMALNDAGLSLLAKPLAVDIGCDVYGPETGAANPYGTLCRHKP